MEIVYREEFQRCIDISGYQLYEDNTVFVMWNWTWLYEVPSSDDDRSVCSDNSEQFRDSDDAIESSDDNTTEVCTIPAIIHSVIFKCIGNLKEHRYQELLALVKKKINKGVIVLSVCCVSMHECTCTCRCVSFE